MPAARPSTEVTSTTSHGWTCPPTGRHPVGGWRTGSGRRLYLISPQLAPRALISTSQQIRRPSGICTRSPRMRSPSSNLDNAPRLTELGPPVSAERRERAARPDSAPVCPAPSTVRSREFAAHPGRRAAATTAPDKRPNSSIHPCARVSPWPGQDSSPAPPGILLRNMAQTTTAAVNRPRATQAVERRTRPRYRRPHLRVGTGGPIITVFTAPLTDKSDDHCVSV